MHYKFITPFPFNSIRVVPLFRQSKNEKDINMTCIQTQDILDLANVKIDPVTCVDCINWNEIPISTAKNDIEQGRLLVAKTFSGISWNDYPGSLTALLSKILNKLPQNRKYHHVTQGFSETLINDVMVIVKNNNLKKQLN